jgi:hypothetical protein
MATGEVVNIIVAEVFEPAPEGCELMDATGADIGWLWVDGAFVPPPQPDEGEEEGEVTTPEEEDG